MLKIFATFEDGSYVIKPAGYFAIIALILVLFVIVSCIRQKESNKLFSTKQLVFSAIAMALAVVTSNIKLFDAPMGGSVTLCSMLFIALIGYWYGLSIGLVSAFAYGLLQLVIDPYIISIPQLLCDYIFAFGALGLAGLFSNQKYGLIKGYLIAIFGRFVFSTISGIVFFADYAPEGMNPFVYSVGYNFSYIAVEGVITLIVIVIPQVSAALKQIKKYALEA